MIDVWPLTLINDELSHMRRERIEQYLLKRIDRRILKLAYQSVTEELREHDGYETVGGNKSHKPSQWSEDFINRIYWVCRVAEERADAAEQARRAVIEAARMAPVEP